MHYVCPSCGSTSESPMACNTAGCNMMGRDMSECGCEDGTHSQIVQAPAI